MGHKASPSCVTCSCWSCLEKQVRLTSCSLSMWIRGSGVSSICFLLPTFALSCFLSGFKKEMQNLSLFLNSANRREQLTLHQTEG